MIKNAKGVVMLNRSPDPGDGLRCIIMTTDSEWKAKQAMIAKLNPIDFESWTSNSGVFG